MLPGGRSGLLVVVALVFLLLLYTSLPSTFQISLSSEVGNEILDDKNPKLYLTDSECSRVFPNAFYEIEIAEARGAIGKAPRHDDEHGYMRARIHDGVVTLLPSSYFLDCSKKNSST